MNAVAVNVMRLRRKLDFATRFMGTIGSEYGNGYRLTPLQAEEPA